MSKPLPTGNFKFMNKRNIDKTFNQLVSETYFPEEKVGKVFQVDIDYPTSLHDYHNDYPFLPEHHEDKLTPTLYNKRYYVLNEHNLIQALKHGLKLVRIHRVLTCTINPHFKGIH